MRIAGILLSFAVSGAVAVPVVENSFPQTHHRLGKLYS